MRKERSDANFKLAIPNGPIVAPFVKSAWAIGCIYFVFGLSLFGPFLGNPFLMDDEIQVTGNPHIQNFSHWLSYFTSSTMSGGGTKTMGGIYFKPLMMIYYATIWFFAGADPFAFRAPLLVLHILSALLIYLIFSRFFQKNAAMAAGLLFLLHPANSEIVAYIADAQDALYMFFGLLGLWLFTRKPHAGWIETASLGLMLMASLLSKETGALFLMLVPFYSYQYQRDRFIRSLLTSCGVIIIYLGLRINAGLTSYHVPVLIIHQATWLERLSTVPLILWHYIEILFFPYRIGLTADFVVKEIGIENFWLPMIACFAAGTAVFRLGRKLENGADKKLYALGIFGLCIWFGLHADAIVPLDGTYADRWLYFGFIPILIILLLAIPANFFNRRRGRILALVIVIAFFIRSRVRLQDWSRPIELYKRELALRPQDAVMANNVGVELFRSGEIAMAEPLFQRATENNPRWDVAWNNLGAVAEHMNQTQRALEFYRKSASLGSYYLAYENYASLLCRQMPGMQECADFVKAALGVFPRNEKLLELEKQLQSRAR